MSKALETLDVPQNVVPKEDNVSLLPKVESFHEVDDVFSTVRLVSSKRRREASRDVRRCFCQRDKRRYAEVKAIGMAANKLRVNQVGVFLDAKVSSADQTSPIFTILAWRDA